MTYKRTKIIGTLGPATDQPDVMEGLLEAGQDLARLNFSHGSYAEHEERLKRFRDASRRIGRHTGVMVDIQGPKIRTGVIGGEPIDLEKGSIYILTTREITGNERECFVG
jgi:pyruvate kinase